jgi:cytochrome c oxidase subunit 2
MRYLFTLLLFLVPALGVWTFVEADRWQLWFPENVSSFGGDIDWLFNVIMYMVAFTFVLTEVCLAWFVFKYSAKNDTKGAFTHGSHKLEMVWTAIPAVALLFIAFLQMGTWAKIKFEGNFPKDGQYTREKPIAEVWASQFDWRIRYPGDDGVLGTVDDLERSWEFVVPVNTDVVFNLRTRDVIHSFFVPEFRLKQDALPGHTIPMWFNAQKEGVYDLVCAELCGWGHYKMSGRVTVVSKEEFEKRMSEIKAEWFSNGKELGE